MKPRWMREHPAGQDKPNWNKQSGLMEQIYHRTSFLSSPERRKMKIYIDLPWGGKLSIEREPMAPYKFYSLCWSLCLAIVSVAFFGIFY